MGGPTSVGPLKSDPCIFVPEPTKVGAPREHRELIANWYSNRYYDEFKS
jgi:hypothetical protein